MNCVAVQKAVCGDHKAWDTLIADFALMIRGVVGRYAKRDADVDDLVQETFLRAYTYLPNLKDSARFPGWLKQIAINVGRSFVQRQDTWVSLDADAGVLNADFGLRPMPNALIVDSEDKMDQVVAKDLVQKALATLSKTRRTVAELHYLKGLAQREVAEHLDVPLGTVKRRLYEVRETLRKEIFEMAHEQVVLKHAVGLETMNKTHTPIFGKGTHLPAACTLEFSIAKDGQESIQIQMLQGDSDQKVACRDLVALDIGGIGSGQKRREPKIKVTFEVDAAGRLHCRAKELPDRVLEVFGESKPILTEEWIT